MSANNELAEQETAAKRYEIRQPGCTSFADTDSRTDAFALWQQCQRRFGDAVVFDSVEQQDITTELFIEMT